MPQKVKFIDKDGYALVANLTFHPLNEEIYPRANHGDDIELLKTKMQAWHDRYGDANHTPITVCPKTGVIYSGNFRVYVATLLNFSKVRAVPCAERTYNPKADRYEEIQFLKSFNQDGKRNESNYKTALRLWTKESEAYFDKYGKELSKKDRNNFATEARIDKDMFRKLVLINEERPELIDYIIAEKMTVRKAYKLVTIQAPKNIVDPNRHTFYDDLKKYPDIVPFAIKKSVSMVREIEAVHGGIIRDPVLGWERNTRTNLFSHSIMSAFTLGFNNTGDKKLRCAAAGAVSNKTYADILFQYLTDLANKKLKGSKDRYFDTQLEIKACEFNSSAGNTKIYSAPGSSKMPSQEFIVACHTGDFSKFLFMMVTVDGSDWRVDSKNAVISLAQLYKLKPTYLLGEMFEGKRKVEVQWGDA
jgi:hypothetical protein